VPSDAVPRGARAVAAVAGAATGDIPDAEPTAHQHRLPDPAAGDDDERWARETTRKLAHVRSGLVNAELGTVG
jgi:hypothetical protein